MKISIYPSAVATARVLILRLITLMTEEPTRMFHIAVSGGSTPALLFDLWANEYKNITPWERLHIYWVDETCVPATHSASNFGLMYSLLLCDTTIPESHIHRIDGTNNPVTEAIRYSGLVRKQLPFAFGVPIFDVVLLGAATDGHLASIHSGQEELLSEPFPYVSTVNAVNGNRCITMTGRVMLHAEHTYFFITGKVKAPIVAEMMTQGDLTPAAFVAHHARNVELFVDKLAASML